MYNNTLGLNYYADIKDAPLYELLRQYNINTENQLMAFSDVSCQNCPDTGRSTVLYTIFCQSGTVDHGKYVPGPVSKSSGENDYNAAFT